MGSSEVAFGGLSFEASDSCLEVWLALLVREIDRLGVVPDWLQVIRKEWDLQATAGFGYGVMADLDRFVTDEGRRDAILSLCAGALARLDAMGPVLSAAELDALGTGGEGTHFTSDVPADAFVRTARCFIGVLDGTLASSETDARFPPRR